MLNGVAGLMSINACTLAIRWWGMPIHDNTDSNNRNVQLFRRKLTDRCRAGRTLKRSDDIAILADGSRQPDAVTIAEHASARARP